MSIHVTHICDRCGQQESTAPAGKPMAAPTIGFFETKGLPENITADLCQPCAAAILIAISRELHPKPTLLKLE